MAAGGTGSRGDTCDALSVTSLYKSYGSLAVLAGVEMAVPESSLAAILGTSGCGKTTLLRTLAGLEAADAGRVTVFSEVVDDGIRHVPAERRQIGYVPQEGALFPHLTVGENVGFALRRGPARRARVRELLAMVGLESLVDRYPHQLSGGQQQRVALARALAPRPRLLLLDEPFSSLDAGMRSSLRDEVRDVLRRSGTTAVLVTHDQDEALSFADTVAVLDHGRICQMGSPKAVYDTPEDPQVARMVGPANLVRGRLQGRFAETVVGRLELRPEVAQGAAGHATVLLRPEQLRLVATGGLTGAPARVVRLDFHGHEAVVTVVLVDAPEAGEIVVRESGAHVLRPGDSVQVGVDGRVFAWPEVPQALAVVDAVG